MIPLWELWKKEVGLWREGSENFVKISVTKQIIHCRFRAQNYVQKHCFYKYDRLHCVIITIVSDIEDITRWREDMNFIFEWQNNILRTSAASE